MNTMPMNHLKEALAMAREASKDKEKFWEEYPYGNAFTVAYGYVALLRRGKFSRDLGKLDALMDAMTFRQEVMFTYLPRVFQRIKPDKRFNELMEVALSGEVRKSNGFVKAIHMSDDEVFIRVMDLSFYSWDNRFVKSLDKLKETLEAKGLRSYYNLAPDIAAKPDEEPQERQIAETPITPSGSRAPGTEDGPVSTVIIKKTEDPDELRKEKIKPTLRTPDFAPGTLPENGLHKLLPDVASPVEEKDKEEISAELKEFKEISEKVRSIREELSKKIYGQDTGISKFAEGIFHALMTEDGREEGGPRGVFLFVGPPGVGKTYMAESLAQLLDLPCKRFNMSEYSSDTDYFQLVGTDPSYKNTHKGLLSKFIESNPDGIIIFDEIEKAGPRVHNIFLQILGLGEYDDDATKDTINCRDTIMIFTSNAGKELYENRQGDLSEIPEAVIMKTIEREPHPFDDRPLINPALCSRFGGGNVILFNHIDEEALLKIVRDGFDKVCREYKEKTSLSITYDERLPLLFLFHYSNGLDARKASTKSAAFLEKEIYQISRQLGNRKDLLDKAKEISFELSLPVDEEIKEYFESKTTVKFVALCGEEMKALFPENSKVFEIEYVDKEIESIEEYSDVYAILIDPYYGCDTNVWHPIGLDDYDCAGMNSLKKIMDSKVGMPIYLLDSRGHISPTDRESLLQMGARGFINLGHGGEIKTLESLSKTLYISRQYRQLAQRGYILDYDTAIEEADDGAKLIISYYDMWKTQAMDEATGQVALRDEERPDTKLSDVVGATAAKEELKYCIEYLKEPLKFIQKTSNLPKGLLLYGPPGTGKTMLARALAGETNCSFFEVAATDLLSPYTGESKDRVKELFDRARKYAPSVIFIDEIDAIGRDRNMGNTDSGINALLTEMDGFVRNADRPVFVLAATNYGAMDSAALSLDPALMRRFDNRIYVGLPKKSDRFTYLKQISAKRGLNISEETLKTIADRTIGQSLDMLNHVFDLAHRMSVRRNEECSDAMLIEAMDEFLYGEKKEYGPEYYEKVAIHEAGHAYVAWKCGLKPGFITIISRGNHGGYTALGELEDKTEYTADELIGLIRTSLAGRAAEMEFYDAKTAVNTGAEGDLMSATQRALEYICKFGMDNGQLVYINLKSIVGTSDYGKYLEKANEILVKQTQEAGKLIREGRDHIKKLADALCDSSYLTEKEILEILK